MPHGNPEQHAMSDYLRYGFSPPKSNLGRFISASITKSGVHEGKKFPGSYSVYGKPDDVGISPDLLRTSFKGHKQSKFLLPGSGYIWGDWKDEQTGEDKTGWMPQELKTEQWETKWGEGKQYGKTILGSGKKATSASARRRTVMGGGGQATPYLQL
tara:strand:+ start:681 stop:1148 length:468 start_codon:yes stop_codon:yes gene_type:complete